MAVKMERESVLIETYPMHSDRPIHFNSSVIALFLNEMHFVFPTRHGDVTRDKCKYVCSA